MSSALVVDGATYLVDCGRAAYSQYGLAGLSLASLKGIFLTHLHADHISDYYNFFILGGSAPPGSEVDTVSPLQVYGPGAAGGLPPRFGGGSAPTINSEQPTPGTVEMTEYLHRAHAYSTNVFMRDMHIRDPRTLAMVHDISLPQVGATSSNTAPRMKPFKVMEDDRVRVTATLVPHGPVFPAFAFRFDTEYGSVTFSGDTARSDNLIELAQGTDILVHEALNIEGATLPSAARDHMLQSHVLVQDVRPIAQEAEAKKLVLSHIDDLAQPIDMRQWHEWAQHGFRGPVQVGVDLQRHVIA